MTTLRTLPGKPANQFETDVEAYRPFNGANCLVIVDVHALGYDFALSEVQAGRTCPSDAEIGDRLEAEIRRRIQACPEGADAKVQLLYHADWKPLPVDKTSNRRWEIQESIRHALGKFRQNNEPRFKKLFLSACLSHFDRQLVDEAFQVPSIERVVTFSGLILLIPGRVCGADEDFRPKPLKIHVWSKDAQGRQVAETPAESIGADEELDLGTLYVEKKTTTASTDRCPTQHPRTGSGTEKVGTYSSRDAAADAIVAFSGSVPPFPYTFALRDAQMDLDAFSCPNPRCPTKAASAVSVTDHIWSIETSILRFILSIFGVNRWVLYVRYDWSSRITCS